MNSIPPSRQFLYALLFGASLICLAFGYFKITQTQINSFKERLERIESKLFVFNNNQKENLATIAHYQNSDRYYIDSEIESMVFLQNEIESLEKIIRHKNFTGDLNITQRLQYLTSSKNRLLFSESDVKKQGQLQEKILTIASPIELNGDDLKNLIEKIEHTTHPKGDNLSVKPQLICLEIRLDKKGTSQNGAHLFLSHLKLLQRDYGDNK